MTKQNMTVSHIQCSTKYGKSKTKRITYALLIVELMQIIDSQMGRNKKKMAEGLPQLHSKTLLSGSAKNRFLLRMTVKK